MSKVETTQSSPETISRLSMMDLLVLDLFLKVISAEFDVDGNGTLDEQEFAKALKWMGQSCPASNTCSYCFNCGRPVGGAIQEG